ncbi:MAG TPA: hypothetical protein VFG89_08605 [Coriobacteriia bacterium]|nr:hypothetical protein [Coriobacteriia bacterium]
MDFEEIWDSIREGRYMVPVSIGILVIALVVVGIVAWPTIKPKPRGSAQSLSTVVTDSAPTSGQPVADKPVPEDVVTMLASDLGIEANKLTIHYTVPGKTNKITVRTQESALKWKEYTYTEQQDGSWAQQ